MTTGTLADAVKACEISLADFHEKPVIVNFGGDEAADELLGQMPKLQSAKIVHIGQYKRKITLRTTFYRNFVEW